MLGLRLDGLTYAEIGIQAGVSRQRVQQVLCPPLAVRRAVIARFGDSCAVCGIRLHGSGHVHHRQHVELELDAYNDFPNLTLLCVSCHRQQHRFPREYRYKTPLVTGPIMLAKGD